MKYPLSLSRKLDEAEPIVAAWRMNLNFDHVIKWILQFNPPDYHLALAVIKNLNVISQEDLRNSLTVAYSKLTRKAIERDAEITSHNTLFAGIGAAGKSGAMLGYHFRLLNEISEENFLSVETERFIEEGRIDNLVLVDDVIATGNQASKEILKLSKKVTPLGVKNIFLLTACGFRDGINIIEDDTKAHTFSAFEYSIEDTATSFDSPFYGSLSHQERTSMKQQLENYGRICSKSPLGYGQIGAFVVFYYNTPNCTLPIVWSDNNGWIPLFRRARRINGITSYYRRFDDAIARKNESDSAAARGDDADVVRAESTLTLLVEGKHDELFFDMLSRKYRLAELIGVKKVSTVAIGGIYATAALLRLLAATVHPALLVLEGDDKTVQTYNRNLNSYGNVPAVFLEPNFLSLTDMKGIHSDGELGVGLPPLPAKLDATSPFIYYEIEKVIVRRGPSSRTLERLRRIVDEYVDPNSLDGFVWKIKKAIGLVDSTGENDTHT